MDERMGQKEIIAIRVRLGLTQRQLALILGTHIVTVSKWERGKNRPQGRSLLILQQLDTIDTPSLLEQKDIMDLVEQDPLKAFDFITHLEKR